MDIIEVEKKLEAVKSLTVDLCKMHGIDNVEVCFHSKGRTAGIAYCIPVKVTYHLHYLLQNYEHFIRTTVFHEVAHLIEWKLYKKMTHGQRWRAIMRGFGFSEQDINRCHSYKDFNQKGYIEEKGE